MVTVSGKCLLFNKYNKLDPLQKVPPSPSNIQTGFLNALYIANPLAIPVPIESQTHCVS